MAAKERPRHGARGPLARPARRAAAGTAAAGLEEAAPLQPAGRQGTDDGARRNA